MLAVKHSPRQTIPELVHRLENDGEVSSSVASEKAMNVFEDNNFRPTRPNQGCEVMEEAGLVSPEACAGSHAGKGEILAGKSCGPDVGVRDSSRVDTLDVLFGDHLGEMLRQDPATKCLLLALEDAFDSGAFKAEVKAPYAGEERRML